ncbi:MAG: PAS domain S-box protein [Alphaproteobacteria bacterium]|nr:PAS domain S-box protein [Alphaproteobacteria bacterium]
MVATTQPPDEQTGLLAAIVDSSDDGIVSKTLDGIVTSWNHAAELIFGFSAAEMVGQLIAMLTAPGHADEMPRILESLRRGQRIEHLETRRRRKDGEIIDVSLTISPIRDGAGNIIGASKIVRDVTVAKRDRAALLEREAQLRSILDTIPDGMVVIDDKGIVQSFSAAAERMFGYSADEVRGLNVALLMPSPHTERHDAYLARYLSTGERRIIGIGRVVTGRRRDGTIFPMELAVGEVKGRERRLFTGFVRDLTERQRTERRLQELQSELSHVSRLNDMGQMASALAHEVNQPLTAATNYIEALRLSQASFASGTGSAAMLDSIASQIARASQIIRHLRQFVQKGEANKTIEDLPQLVEEASALALIGAKDGNVRVQLHFAPALPRVSVDKVQIQQVLVNLLRNAVEAMAETPRRELTVTSDVVEAGRVTITVADTGTGIAPEIADRLFRPFVTTKAHGMGVGLSICHSIVEDHGSRLQVSANPEGGTIFSFSVPAAAAD